MRRRPMLLAALVASLVAAVVISASPSAAEPEYVCKVGSVVPDGTPWAEDIKRIKKRVEEGSNGRVKMKLFLGGSLGGEVELVRAMRRGRIQGFGGTTAAIAEGASIPQFQLMELPFLFSNFAEADHVLDNVLHDDYVRLLSEKGFILGQWHENGWRNFASKSRPIRSLADLKGMKMRAQESPVHLAMYEAFGAQAESIPVPEVLGALSTGMVDGFDNTTLFAAAAGWHEAIKYFTVSEHIYQPGAIVYSKKFIDELPEKYRKLFFDDPVAAAAASRKAVRALGDELTESFRQGGIEVIKLSETDRAAFAEKAQKVHDAFAPIVGADLLKKVRAARAAVDKQSKGGSVP